MPPAWLQGATRRKLLTLLSWLIRQTRMRRRLRVAASMMTCEMRQARPRGVRRGGPARSPSPPPPSRGDADPINPPARCRGGVEGGSY